MRDWWREEIQTRRRRRRNLKKMCAMGRRWAVWAENACLNMSWRKKPRKLRLGKSHA